MPTFGYLSIRGLAQPIRFLLAYLGVEYTQKSYSDLASWLENDKANLGILLPNIPYYIDGDVNVTESSAIPIYLIKKNNRSDLLGQNVDGSYNEREVRIQQVSGVVQDIFKEFFPILFNPDFNNLKDQVFTDKVSPLYNKILAYLGEKDFLVGSLSYSDFIFYELLSYFRHIYPASITPNVAAYIQRFENLPGIKDYLISPNINLNHFLIPHKAVWSGPQ